MHYIPKKKRYDCLTTLYKEMLAASLNNRKKLKILSFFGHTIEIMYGKSKFFYAMDEEIVMVRDNKGKEISRIGKEKGEWL